MIKAPGPIVLTVALVIFALGTAALAWFFPDVPSLTGVTSLDPKGHPSTRLKAEDLQDGVDIWNKPVLWTAPVNGHRLFNPIDILFYPAVYPTGDYLKKMDSSVRLPGGVLISWYQKYGIQFTDANVDREDPDNDGFSNIAEFKNEPVGQRLKAVDCDGSNSCNPIDAQSHPSYLSRLRLKEYESKPFHITFNSYNTLSGKYLFQIRLTDLPDDQQPAYKRTGDKLGVEDYIVGEFHQSTVQEKDPTTGIVGPVDRSTLEIIKPDIDKHIILPFQSNTDSPESTADFVMLMPADRDKVLKVAVGKVLSVPYLTGDEAKFKVLEVTDTGAKIRNLKTNQDYHIFKLSPSDWDDVPTLSTENTGKAP